VTRDPYLDPTSICRLLEALQLHLRYAGQAVEAGDLEKAEHIVAGVREGCDLVVARLRMLRAPSPGED
jgi:hypothetical protein